MSQAYVSYYYGGWPEGFKEWRKDINAPIWLFDRNTGQAVIEETDNGKTRLFVRQTNGAWQAIGWKYTPFGYGTYHYRLVNTSLTSSYLEKVLWTEIEIMAYRELEAWKKANPTPVKVPTKKQQKYFNAGLKPEDYNAMRKWRRDNEAIVFGMSVEEKVIQFYGLKPLYPIALVQAGLKAEDAQEFFDFAQAQTELTGRYASLSDRVKAFYVSRPVVVILHNAHVELMVSIQRRKRANELRALRRQAVREGQGFFRLHVLANHSGCAITGLTDGVEAAHIVPHAAGGAMSATNGLALVSWLHTAFDAQAFTIDPVTLTVIVSPAARTWLNIDGVQLVDGQIFELDRTALVNHFERFKEAHGL